MVPNGISGPGSEAQVGLFSFYYVVLASWCGACRPAKKNSRIPTDPIQQNSAQGELCRTDPPTRQS